MNAIIQLKQEMICILIYHGMPWFEMFQSQHSRQLTFGLHLEIVTKIAGSFKKSTKGFLNQLLFTITYQVWKANRGNRSISRGHALNLEVAKLQYFSCFPAKRIPGKRAGISFSFSSTPENCYQSTRALNIRYFGWIQTSLHKP